MPSILVSQYFESFSKYIVASALAFYFTILDVFLSAIFSMSLVSLYCPEYLQYNCISQETLYVRKMENTILQVRNYQIISIPFPELKQFLVGKLLFFEILKLYLGKKMTVTVAPQGFLSLQFHCFTVQFSSIDFSRQLIIASSARHWDCKTTLSRSYVV